MGNVIGTISYDPVDHDLFANLVYDRMKKHKFKLAEQPEYVDGKQSISVEISGLYLWWYGEKNAKRDINQFLYYCENDLLRNGATGVEYNVIHLPM
jgi:hypothetical protein